jgi:D-alanyl-D-alanine carboxypeptidase
VGVLVAQSLASTSFSVASPVDLLRNDPVPGLTDQSASKDDHRRPEGRHPGIPRGEGDGAVPHGVTVFDDEIPAVGRLDGALLGALQRAATDAADDGIEIFVKSGWRSRAYQEQLFREAVSKYGSEKEASRWVATADTSAHVSGDAVDVGPLDATAWLSEHGAEYGLCQIYRNEPWHYELRPKPRGHHCPPMYADPTHDPRMQKGP